VSVDAPMYGVRISLGVVTYWNDEPIRTYEMACRALERIEQTTGERGTIDRILASLPMPTRVTTRDDHIWEAPNE
jgi:hypothetical protein